jgi:hypothetical protein
MRVFDGDERHSDSEFGKALPTVAITLGLENSAKVYKRRLRFELSEVYKRRLRFELSGQRMYAAQDGACSGRHGLLIGLEAVAIPGLGAQARLALRQARAGKNVPGTGCHVPPSTYHPAEFGACPRCSDAAIS